MSRGQVDLKDMLRPLKFKTASTVAEVLMKIWKLIGPPTVLLSLAIWLYAEH